MNGDTVIVSEQQNQVVVTDGGATIISVSQQGPAGPQGEQGPSGDKNYTQSFTNSSTVTVTHNLGKYVSVAVINTAGDEVEGDIDQTSINQLTLSFSNSFSGTVVCN